MKMTQKEKAERLDNIREYLREYAAGLSGNDPDNNYPAWLKTLLNLAGMVQGAGGNWMMT